jgi:hypothetical protein
MASVQQNGQRFGVSEPISMGGPTEFDVIKTRELEKHLQDVGLYESKEEAVRREEVLGILDQIVKTWIKTISRAKGLNDQLLHEANAKIFTFGSYRLGVMIKIYRRFSFVLVILLVLRSRGKGNNVNWWKLCFVSVVLSCETSLSGKWNHSSLHALCIHLNILRSQCYICHLNHI